MRTHTCICSFTKVEIDQHDPVVLRVVINTPHYPDECSLKAVTSRILLLCCSLLSLSKDINNCLSLPSEAMQILGICLLMVFSALTTHSYIHSFCSVLSLGPFTRNGERSHGPKSTYCVLFILKISA